MHYTHTQNAINNTQFVFIWFLIFSFFINASFWYYLTFSFDAIWFQWSVWKSICLKLFLQLLEMCLFRMRSISEWEKNGKCIILHNRKLMNWIKILDILFSVKWIKMWIIFHFSFSILLAQCINGISFCSVTNLKPFFPLAFSCKINAWDLIQTNDSILWAFFNPIYSLWAFFVPNEKQKIHQRMRYKSDLTCHNRTTRTYQICICSWTNCIECAYHWLNSTSFH